MKEVFKLFQKHTQYGIRIDCSPSVIYVVQLFKEDHMYKPPKLFEMLSYQNIYPLEGGDKLMKTNNVDGVV